MAAVSYYYSMLVLIKKKKKNMQIQEKLDGECKLTTVIECKLTQDSKQIN